MNLAKNKHLDNKCCNVNQRRGSGCNKEQKTCNKEQKTFVQVKRIATQVAAKLVQKKKKKQGFVEAE